MTVSYSLVVSSSSLATFFKLMARWRGSIFKVVYKEGLVYFGIYAALSLLYRFGLSPASRRHFENVVLVCRNWSASIPVTFILGFYVSVVFNRWRQFVENIPWIDNATLSLVYVAGGDKVEPKGGRGDARTRGAACRAGSAGGRWCGGFCLRAISVQVKHRFPSTHHLVDAKLLSRREVGLLASTESHIGDSKHWVPVAWSARLLYTAHADGLIKSPNFLSAAIVALDRLREKQQALLNLDWINVPLVYTQLVSIAVWTNFGFALLGNQWLDPSSPNVKDPVDLFMPVFTLVQFVCFVGWLRVAQSMLNPLGERDDDLELNFILDRNLRLGMQLADMVGAEGGPPYPDDGTGLTASSGLPHTAASHSFAAQGVEGSAQRLCVPRKSATTSAADRVPRSKGLRGRISALLGRRRTVWAVEEAPGSLTPTARP